MLADRLKTLAPSSTLAVQAKAKELRARGIDVISFGAGEPDFDTPQRIKDAGAEAMRRGQTKYTEVGGVPELRAAICGKLKRDNGLAYEPADILVSVGAKHTLFNLVVALINPGDEVLMPSPYWVSYPEQVQLMGGVAVPVETHRGHRLRPRSRPAAGGRHAAHQAHRGQQPEQSDRRRVLVGCAAGGGAPGRRARRCGSSRTSATRRSPSRVGTSRSRRFGPEIKARTIVVNTCSKAYAMTGWRIGYAAGDRTLIRAMTDVQSQVTSNPASIAQWAAVEALAGTQDEVAKMAGEFDRRRRLIVAGLNALPGVSCIMPKGAFYAFANVSGLFGRTWRRREGALTLKSSLDVTSFLLEEARVAVVPGRDFGSDAHVRMSYATSDALISDGLARMSAAIATLQ